MKGLRRRQLLQLAGTGCLLAGVPAAAGLGKMSLRGFVVETSYGSSVLQAGCVLAVDISGHWFEGAGLYMYPAWGRPRPYQIDVEPDGTLIFSNPGQREVLWRQRLDGEAGHFAGRVLGVLPWDQWLGGRVRPLHVPEKAIV